MGEACGVSWDGTSSGTLDESAIPNDDFESHYLNAGDTKSDSSFPVVDGDGNLRAGNVSSAWDLRGQGEGVSEECLRKLAAAFDENPLPDSATDNSQNIMRLAEQDDPTYGMNIEFARPRESILGDGFNEYGVREREDGSIDVRFEVMEPGVRRGVEVTPSFLRNVATHSAGRIPLQLDHSQSQRANVGFIKPQDIQFNDVLQSEVHIPNTGSSIRDDIIADFTHDPPQIQDISIGFNPKSIEVEPPSEKGEPPQFVDGTIKEMSLTPFPAGYDDGGLTPEFSSAVDKFKVDGACTSGCDEPVSRLVEKPHIITK